MFYPSDADKANDYAYARFFKTNKSYAAEIFRHGVDKPYVKIYATSPKKRNTQVDKHLRWAEEMATGNYSDD